MARKNSSNSRNRNNGNLLDPNQVAFNIRVSLVRTQQMIDKCFNHYDKTGDLNALKVAFDGLCSLGDLCRTIQELYGPHSYGYDFELTK